MKSNAQLTYQDAQSSWEIEYDPKIHFHAIWILQNMHNIVSLKRCLTYREHATYTYMQESYHEQATWGLKFTMNI